jgi:hypothetical protein
MCVCTRLHQWGPLFVEDWNGVTFQSCEDVHSNHVRIWHSNHVRMCCIPIMWGCVAFQSSECTPFTRLECHTPTKLPRTHKFGMPHNTHTWKLKCHTLTRLESTRPHKIGMPPHTPRNWNATHPHEIGMLSQDYKLECLHFINLNECHTSSQDECHSSHEMNATLTRLECLTPHKIGIPLSQDGLLHILTRLEWNSPSQDWDAPCPQDSHKIHTLIRLESTTALELTGCHCIFCWIHVLMKPRTAFAYRPVPTASFLL